MRTALAYHSSQAQQPAAPAIAADLRQAAHAAAARAFAAERNLLIRTEAKQADRRFTGERLTGFGGL